MQRLISILAAGLLTAGTVLPAAGTASAATAVQQPSCTNFGPYYFNVSKSSVNFYLGGPKNSFNGATARLKSRENRTTQWILCAFTSSSNTTLIENGGLALTSRSSSAGANVTLESAGNGGNGFASQHWIYAFGSSTVTFQSVKTGLFLRIRNNGPIMGQAVTTGSTSTSWNWIFQ